MDLEKTIAQLAASAGPGVVGLEGGPLAFLVGQLFAGVPAFVISARMLRLSVRELASALAAPAAPSGLLAGVLLIAMALTTSATPLVSLLLVAVLSVAVYAAGAALFARSVIVPMWASLRARGA